MENTHTIKVTWGDTDAAAIVFFPNFYRWMDQATHELFESGGLPVSKIHRENNVLLPLLETFCKFKSPLIHEDRVTIISKTELLENNKTFKVSHRFMKNDKEVAKGYEIRAWTTLRNEKLRTVQVPEEVRRAIFD